MKLGRTDKYNMKYFVNSGFYFPYFLAAFFLLKYKTWKINFSPMHPGTLRKTGKNKDMIVRDVILSEMHFPR